MITLIAGGNVLHLREYKRKWYVTRGEAGTTTPKAHEPVWEGPLETISEAIKVGKTLEVRVRKTPKNA